MMAQPAAPLDLIGGTVLGAVLLLLLFGWLWAKPSVEVLLKANKQKDEELAALRKSLDERVIPAVEHSTLLADRVASLLETRIETDRRIVAALDRIDGNHG